MVVIVWLAAESYESVDRIGKSFPALQVIAFLTVYERPA
jgi:hypothetical protein